MARTWTSWRQALLNERLSAVFAERHHVDLSHGFSGIGRVRANIYRQRGTVAMALRMIATQIPTAADLNLPPAIEMFSKTKRGMVLVTGATGSGKSTTLAALIEMINARDRRHIVTIEDPIEYLFKDKLSVINQREVGIDTPDFGSAMRAALRQDPDVIFIGELRDAETITTAVRASETGHLVISTLHAPNCYDAISRLVSYFPPEEQDTQRKAIAANLRGVISQRLLPRADGSSRVAAFEVMVVTPTIADMIEDPQRQSDIIEVIKTGRQHGMISFDDYLFDLAEGGPHQPRHGAGQRHQRDRPEAALPGVLSRAWQEFRAGSRPISRVLSRAIIRLRRPSPTACSDLPGDRADHAS